MKKKLPTILTIFVVVAIILFVAFVVDMIIGLSR
jgi:preprotein translocase subunit SecE